MEPLSFGLSLLLLLVALVGAAQIRIPDKEKADVPTLAISDQNDLRRLLLDQTQRVIASQQAAAQADVACRKTREFQVAEAARGQVNEAQAAAQAWLSRWAAVNKVDMSKWDLDINVMTFKASRADAGRPRPKAEVKPQ